MVGAVEVVRLMAVVKMEGIRGLDGGSRVLGDGGMGPGAELRARIS